MKFLSSYFFRLALLVAILPVLVMGAALLWTYNYTEAQLRTERANQINDDIAALVEIYTDQGQGALVRSIENRLSLVPKTRARAHYALVGQNKNKLAGDLTGQVLVNTDYTRFIDWQVLDTKPLIVRATPLRGGEILHVARNDEIRQRTLARLRRTFFLMTLATLGLGLLAGFLASYVFKRRIKAINETCEKIAQGHLSARVPGNQNEDELGALGNNVNSMLERIGKLIRLRKNITDQVAHELRSPLTRLDASLVKAAAGAKNPEDIEAARGEITNCISLLDALLDVSSLEAQGGDKTGFGSVNLSELALQMAGFYQGLAEEKNIKLSIDAALNITLEGDAMQLSRLVANLLDNAIKYTPEGGAVHLAVGAGPILSVQDSGPGVPKKLQSSIFTPFFRDPGLLTGRGRNISGHGLGLALSQAIAKRHDLKLRVGEAEAGALFVLSA